MSRAAAITPERLYEFFVLVALRTHESWLADIPESLVQRAKQSSLGVRLLSLWIRNRADLRVPEQLEIAGEHAWVLGPREQLMAAASRLGALSLSQAFRQQVESEQVKRARAALGEELYSAVLAQRKPIATGLSASALLGAHTVDDVRDVVRRAGIAVMLATLPADQRDLLQRAEMRFPMQDTTALTTLPTIGDPTAVQSILAPISSEA